MRQDKRIVIIDDDETLRRRFVLNFVVTLRFSERRKKKQLFDFDYTVPQTVQQKRKNYCVLASYESTRIDFPSSKDNLNFEENDFFCL